MDKKVTSELAATMPHTANERPKYKVVGVRVDAVNMQDAIAQIQEWIEARARGKYVAVTGMHGVSESLRDPSLRDIINQAGLVVPDGMPLVWLARWHGVRLKRRVTGSDLMETFCRKTGSRYRHYFYGGAPGVAEDLANKLRVRFNIDIAGTFTPPFRALTAPEELEVSARVNHASPDILWVGLSTPKQERWMHAHRDTFGVPVMIGVGAAFDMHSGRLDRAPAWIQELGFEWFYRLVAEPQRLWKRYLVVIPRAVCNVLLEMLHILKYD
jgi:N-acetylglucosaminyldiphosphoundecaprenol N-acetyl-beta-D-mannosaminyltransferase